MNRQRHQDRADAVNARARAHSLPGPDWITVEGDVPKVEASEPYFAEMLDRLRFGDCNGFGAPQARRFRREAERR